MDYTIANATVVAALEALLANPAYGLLPALSANPNADGTWAGQVEEAHIQIQRFDSFGETWISVSVAFGEVRHIWNNHTPLGERGIASASSRYRTQPDTYSVLPGSELTGLSWRVGVVGPMDRVSSGLDEFRPSEDIVASLLALRDEALHVSNWIASSPRGNGSAARGLWEEATPGW